MKKFTTILLSALLILSFFIRSNGLFLAEDDEHIEKNNVTIVEKA